MQPAHNGAMKHLFERFRGGPHADASPPAADDEGFYATQFMERPESVRATSAWAARALGVGAHPLPADQALPALDRVWGQDHFYAALMPPEREQMSRLLEFVAVPAGRELIHQDEKGDYAMVVLSGVVGIDRVQPTGERARLAEARDGDVIGEMSLVDAGARFASCLTLTPCHLAIVSGQSLDDMAIDDPRIGMALMACMARRLSLRTRQLSARLGALLASQDPSAR